MAGEAELLVNPVDRAKLILAEGSPCEFPGCGRPVEWFVWLSHAPGPCGPSETVACNLCKNKIEDTSVGAIRAGTFRCARCKLTFPAGSDLFDLFRAVRLADL